MANIAIPTCMYVCMYVILHSVDGLHSNIYYTFVSKP